MSETVAGWLFMLVYYLIGFFIATPILILLNKKPHKKVKLDRVMPYVLFFPIFFVWEILKFIVTRTFNISEGYGRLLNKINGTNEDL